MRQGTILGSQIGKWLILVALVAAFAALLTASVVRAQEESTTIEYAENGTDPVATFTATDPEGATTITWSIPTEGSDPDGDGDLTTADTADAGDFEIDEDGMLKFSSPPDYEAETSGGGDADNDNTYHVVVSAADAATGGEAGYHKVTVKVTNVAEKGKVTWTVDPSTVSGVDANDPDDGEMPIMQFQVGAVLTATATDGDMSGETKTITATIARWQWYRSSSKNAMGTVIDGQITATYPVTTEDVGMYLRVEAFYNVDTGREESASLTSEYPVLGSRTNNDAPEFDPATVTREVSEGKKGMTVGAPVRATDDISNALNYTLAGTDAAKFGIDQKTGQITTMVDLDRERTTDVEADSEFGCGASYECVVTVRATDSAGAATGGTAAGDPDDATVTIKLTNVDEKPTFVTDDEASTDPAESPKAITVRENNMDLHGAEADGFSQAEAVNVTYRATDPEGLNVTYRLMGDDGAKFQLSGAGVLSFKEKPDYEKPTDRNKDNVYEVTVRASDDTIYADQMVKVTVTDDDEGPTVMGKDSFNYAENGKDAVATFTAEDPEGATTITWSIPTEGSDPDGDGDLTTADTADAGDFEIDEDGMLKFSSPPDYEAETSGGGDADNDNTYHVVVSAADAATGGEAGYHKVTVKVTNVAEKGKVTWTVDPSTVSGVDANDPDDGEMPIMQFQVGAVLTATATDGDIVGADKDVADDVSWRWYRGAAEIDGRTTATYPVTTEDVNKRIRVEVAYTVDEGREESASLTSEYPVLGSRTNNDAPEFDPATVTREVSEGKKGMTVGAPVRATDDISNALNYTLAGTDAAKFGIDQKTGQITTMVDLDRERTTDVEADSEFGCGASYECVVTVRATDSAGAATGGTAAGDPDDATVTIKLTNVDEKPTFVTDDEASTDPAESPKAITVRENNMDLHGAEADGFSQAEAVNVTYRATDPEGLNVNLSLMGPDAAKFSLGTGGVLSFKTAPDYEMPADANRDNVYEVTMRASDGTMYADRMVRVTVTKENEAPMILAPGVRVSGPSSLDYAEKDTEAVGTYTASGSQAASARWKLEGDDAGDFRLDGSGMSRMLKFKSSPNYEMPMDADTDNTYMVTVKASYGRGAEMGMDTQAVTVYVTNMEEKGTVMLSSMTPVVGITVTATLTDYDTVMEDSVMWQWSKSKDGDEMPIADGVTSDGAMSSYTPVAGDDGYRLMAKATYTDGYDSGNEEMDTTTSAVVSNRAPMFTESPTATRMIAENSAAGTAVGTPVMATDADGDELTYDLTGADAMYFTIGTSTGQIMVGMDTMLDYEAEKMTYMVTVTATDDSGVANDSDSIEVTINVTDVNEAPTFEMDMATRDVAENTEAGMAIGVAFDEATDPDGDMLTYSLDGDDAESFDFDASTRQIKTMAPLDYETNNMYMVTVTATDDDMATDTINVTINVTDVNEAPMFAEATATRSIDENSAAGTNVGDPVMMATDPDDDTLTYALSGDDAMYFSIDDMRQIMVGASAMLDYEAEKKTYMVMVTAMDPDGESAAIEVTINVADVNEAPMFADATATRSIDENSAAGTNVGDPVMMATDPDGDTLAYSLSGDDAMYFSIDDMGQIMVGASAMLDYETNMSHMVTVTATDPGGETDTIDVTIEVTDVNEAPVFAGDTAARSIDENSDAGTAVGAPVTATDPDAGDTLAYSLSGDDAMYFSIDDMGQIMVGADAMLDHETKNSYSVMVIATDSAGLTSTIDVTVMITVTDVNEAPIFNDGAMATRSIAENTEANTNIGNPLTAADPEEDELSYSLGGDDAASFDIDPATGQLMTKEALDYETKKTYTVTVEATEMGTDPVLTGTIDVTIDITNVDEPGTVTLSSMDPIVGVELTAMLTDPDGFNEEDVTWEWSRSETVEGTYTQIDVASANYTYTPTTDDKNYYLRARAKYTDGQGSEKTAAATSEETVRFDPVRYDTDGTPGIRIAELFDAIDDYFAGGISIAELFEVIDEYFG